GCLPDGSGKAAQNAPDVVKIAATEKVDVYEQRVQLVDIETLAETRRVRECGLVSLIKSPVKSPEQFGHSQINLTVTEIYRGVDETRIARVVNDQITAP